MAENLGKAVLELDADATPASAAMAVLETESLARMRALGAKLSTMFGSNMKAAVAVGAAAGVVALGALGAGAYKLGQTFDDAFDIIRTKTGAVGTELDGLKQSFKNVVSSVPTDMKTAAEAIGEVQQRLGLTGKPLEDMTAQLLELSRITGTDLSTNIASVSKAMVDWEVPAREMGPTLDQLFRLSQKTGIGVSDLATSVQKFGSPLRQLGFSLQESAAMFAIFEKAGVNTQTMTGGMKIGLANLIKPTDELKGQLRDLGVTAQAPGDKLRQLIKIMGDETIPQAERTGLAMEVFGKRAGADMAEAIAQGRFSLDGMVKQMRDGSTTIRDTAEDTNDLSEKWQIFRNKLAVRLEPISSAVFDQVNAALIFLMDNANIVLPAIGVLLGALGLAAATWAATTSIAAAQVVFAWFMTQMSALKSAAVQVVSFALLIGQWIIMGVQAMASAAMVAAAWLIALGPVGLVIAAVAALVAFIILKWDWVKQATVDVWNWIKGFFARWWPLLLGIMTGGIGLIVGLIIKNWDSVVKATATAWDWFKETIVDRVVAVLKFIGGIPGKVLNALGDLGRLLYDAGKAIVQGLIDGITDMLGALAKKIGDLGGMVVDGVKGILGISSPSRVFMDIGGDVVEGFRIGLDADVAGLAASVGGLGATVMDAAAVAPTAPPSDPATARLAEQLALLNSRGGAAALDALMEAINERLGYRGVAGRMLTTRSGLR